MVLFSSHLEGFCRVLNPVFPRILKVIFYFVIKLVWFLACLQHYFYFYGRENFSCSFLFVQLSKLLVFRVWDGKDWDGVFDQKTTLFESKYPIFGPTLLFIFPYWGLIFKKIRWAEKLHLHQFTQWGSTRSFVREGFTPYRFIVELLHPVVYHG